MQKGVTFNFSLSESKGMNLEDTTELVDGTDNKMKMN